MREAVRFSIIPSVAREPYSYPELKGYEHQMVKTREL
jgi:hypothetical protein